MTAPAGKEAPGAPARNTAGAAKRRKGISAINSKMGQCKMCKAHGVLPLDAHRTSPRCPTWTGCDIDNYVICQGIKFGKTKGQSKAATKVGRSEEDSVISSGEDATRCMKSSVSLAKGWKTTGSNTRSTGRAIQRSMTLGSQQTAWVIRKQLWQHTRKASPKAQNNEQGRRFVYIL